MQTSRQIADAVVAVLDAGFHTVREGTSLWFKARRLSAVRFDAEELTALTVTVVPRGLTDVPVARAAIGRTFLIDVGIQQRLDASGGFDAQVESLLDNVDEIRDWLTKRENQILQTGDSSVGLIKAEQDPLYYQQHLLEKHVFTAVLSLSYTAAGVA